MFSDCLPDRPSEPYWHGIPDHLTDAFERAVRIRFHELVSLGKRLENSAFPQRNTSILLWMSEAAVAEPVELCSDGRRWFVPFHAAINARIMLATLFFMAIRAELSGPIAPSSARLRNTNALQISSR